MNSTIANMLDELIGYLKDLYGDKIKEIVLYGSYAKGTEDEESDIDVAVILDIDEQEIRMYEKRLNEIISEISYKYMKVISLIDLSYEKFISWCNVLPFYKNILNEGVILYAR